MVAGKRNPGGAAFVALAGAETIEHRDELDGPASPRPPELPANLSARNCYALRIDDQGRWWLFRFHRGRLDGPPINVGGRRAEALRKARELVPAGVPGFVEGAE